ISGTAQDSRTLTAADGTWSGTPAIAFTRQWRRCDPAGSGCTDVAGATGATYPLTPADVGSTIRVVVTGTNAAGGTPVSSAPTVVVTALPPANTSPPSIGGLAYDGRTLAIDRGSWTGTPTIGYLYQWRRCDAAGAGCADVAGATGTTYDLVTTDVGSTFRVVVTGVNAGGTTPATTAPTAVVTPEPPTNTGAPSVSGVARDGETLTADGGGWSGAPTITYDYQWQRCAATCTDVPGATALTYELGPADVGLQMRVRVTATNAGGGTTAPSPQTGVVAARPPVNTTAPSVAGQLQSGRTLTIDPGGWSGTPDIGYAYVWQRCDASGAGCADIPGATGAAYVLTSADVGRTVRGVVTGANAGGSDSAATSVSGTVEGTAPVTSGRPAIAGTPAEGSTLTAQRGDWTGAGPIAYGYRWLRCDASGNACTEVPGASGPTYTLGAADVGHAMRVVVTATNADGSRESTSGDTAAVIARPADPGEDLTKSLPDSLVSPSRCQRVLAGTGFKRQKIKGVGRVGVKIVASDYISPAKPLKVRATIPGSKVRSLAYILDKKVVSRPTRAPYALSLSPKLFARASAHDLALKVTPRKGRPHRMTLHITTAPCTNVLSAFQWRTDTGTGLRLRIDSRASMGAATFRVPPAMLPKLTDAGTKVGQAQLYVAGGRKPVFGLTLAKGDRTATLLRPSALAPRVVLTRTGVSLTGLPAKVGILEVTLYTRDRTSPDALLKKRQKATIGATAVVAGKPVKMTTVVSAQRH
ncbi:MAG TPA: hypothetical protein VJT75_07395, partial [Thermoleophilaceae bacterium]|nr:hypothetical protein [Thermoleophilaceae bacterium]